MNIYDIINRARSLREEYRLDSVTPERLGALHEDTLTYINQYQLLASSPAIHKTFVSVSAMQGSASPTSDLTGRPLKAGQLVVIVPSDQTDSTAGDVYRYDGPSGSTSKWTFVAKLGAVPADSELSATSTNPPQNRAVTEKLTELDYKINNINSELNGNLLDVTYHNAQGVYYIARVNLKKDVTYRFSFDKGENINPPYLYISSADLTHDYLVKKNTTFDYTPSEDLTDVWVQITCQENFPTLRLTVTTEDNLENSIDNIQQDITNLGQETDNVERRITTGGVLNLNVIAPAYISSQLQPGEYGYHTENQEIIYKTEDGYETIYPTLDGLYRYQDKYYRFNGTKLVEEFSPTDMSADITELEQDISNIKERIITGGVLNLASIAASSVSAQLQIGEYGYNTGEQYIVYKTEDGSEIIYPTLNGLYRYQDKYYRFDGEKLIEDFSPIGISEEIADIRKEASFATEHLQPTTITKTGQLGESFYYFFKAGKTYRIRNIMQTITPELFTRLTSEGETVDSIGKVSGFAEIEFTPSADAEFLRVAGTYTSEQEVNIIIELVDSMHLRVDELEYSVTELQQGIAPVVLTKGQPSKHFLYDFKEGETYKITNHGWTTGFQTRNEEDGESVDVIGNIGKDMSAEFTATANSKYLYVGYSGNDYETIIEVEWVSQYLQKKVIDLENDVNDITSLLPPYVEFDYDTELIDVVNYIGDIMSGSMVEKYEKTQDAFDSLVAEYPSFVTREDAAEKVGLTYPTYANLNGEASGDYLATPTYRTYMYKFSESNPYVNTSRQQKRKLFLVGGTHGAEFHNPLNLYIFAKRLCESTDKNFFKLRSAFDVYIIPQLNGYGLFHNQRPNANGVDLNRNYPTTKWVYIPQYDDGGNINVRYSGEEPGDQFETQLVMAMLTHINPDIAIDHHDYGALNRQFYTNVYTAKLAKLCYQSLVDCSFAFIKGMPEYFGTAFKLFVDDGTFSPGYYTPTTSSADTYFFEQGIPVGSTIEMSTTLNYADGVVGTYVGEPKSDVFKVAEYTLRIQIFRFAEYVMKNFLQNM